MCESLAFAAAIVRIRDWRFISFNTFHW